MPHETHAHSGESINVGRMSGGQHHENIVATAEKTPRRGDTGAGCAIPPANEHGMRYSLKAKGKKSPIKG